MAETEQLARVVKIVRAVAVMFLAGGIVLAWMGASHVKEAKRSLSWPIAKGVVKESKMLTKRHSKGRMGYCASVVYGYSVDGAALTGDRLGFDRDWKNNPQKPLETLKKYPPGAEIKVHYDPDQPGQSVLEPGATTGSWLFFIIGFAFLVSGAIDYWLIPWLVGVLAAKRLNTDAW
ncbi:MAG: DUF3592 domain-containing protein [Deltaproteobacteria bacterium]|nr:DUF3592 domain-containing protein [Deltaproteobacteria bacterium]